MAAGKTLAKGSMGAFHKLLDPLLRAPRAVAGEADQLAKIAKRMDVDSIVRQGDKIVVSKNGWRHTLDSRGRAVRVDQPDLKINKTQGRSATNQKRAGGPDRLPSDEGGHYGGRRFDGPTHEFNHFAQDMNLNRGAYKKLENEWERLVKDGKQVRVEITPKFRGSSQRPDILSIKVWVDGELQPVTKFRNRAGG